MHPFAIKLEITEDGVTGLPTFGFQTGDMVITDPFVSECGRFAVEPSQYGVSEADARALVALNKALVEGVEVALNAGALVIQKALDIKAGDAAAVFFSDDEHRKLVTQAFAEYVAAELAQPVSSLGK